MLLINLARHLTPSAYRVAQLLSDMTFEDVTTGTYGARYLRRFLEEQIASDEPFVLTLFDFDRFASINEGQGPLEGDSLLRTLAVRLRTVLRGNDIIARHGKAGLAVVTFGRGAEAMFKIADTIRQRLADKPIKPKRGGKPIKLTLSGSIASFPEDAPSLDGILEAAQTTLFAAKKQGRNRILLASQADSALKAEGSTLSALPCGRFVGRRNELSLSELFSEEVRDRKAGLLLVIGDRGAGKTRLLKELVGVVRGRGIVYLLSMGSGSPNRISRALLYLVQRYYERHPATRDWLRRALNPLQRKCLGELVPLFGPWRGLKTERDPNLAPLAREALEGALVGMAREAPLLLMLDNIGDIDEVALEALRPILRENKAPIGVVGTIADELGLDHGQSAPLVDFLAELGGRKRLRSVYLPRMTAFEMRLMMGEMLPGLARPPWFDEAFAEACKGNPGFAEDAVRGLVEQGKLLRTGRTWKCQAADAAELKALLGEALGRASASEATEVLTNATAMGGGWDPQVFLRQDWTPGIEREKAREAPKRAPAPQPAKPAPAPTRLAPWVTSDVEPPATTEEKEEPPAKVEESDSDTLHPTTTIALSPESFRRARVFIQTLSACVSKGRLYPQWAGREGGPLAALREAAQALLDKVPFVTLAVESDVLHLNSRSLRPREGEEYITDFVRVLSGKLVWRLTMVAGLEAREIDALARELWSPLDPARMKDDHWARFRERHQVTHVEVLQRAYGPSDARAAGGAMSETVRGEQALAPEQAGLALEALQALSGAAVGLRRNPPENDGVEAALQRAVQAVQGLVAQASPMSFDIEGNALSINGRPSPSQDGAQFFMHDLAQKGWQTLTVRNGITAEEIRALVSVLSVTPDETEAVAHLRVILGSSAVQNFALAHPPAPPIEKIVDALVKAPVDVFLGAVVHKNFEAMFQEAVTKENLAEAVVARLAALFKDENVEIRRKALGAARDGVRKLKGRSLVVFIELTTAVLKERVLQETDQVAQTTLAAFARLWLPGAVLADRTALAAEVCWEAIKPALASSRMTPESREAFISAMQAVGQGAGSALMTLLVNGTEHERESALIVLGVVGQPLVAQLVRVVQETDKPEVRGAAARAVGAIGGAASKDLMVLVTAQADPGVACRVLDVLELTGASRVVDPVRAAFEHPDSSVKEAAVRLLQRVSDPVAQDAVRFLIRSPDASVLCRALEIAAARKMATISTEVVRLAQSSEDEQVAHACCVYFQAVPIPAAVPALQRIYEMRGKFLGLLGKWSDKTRAAAVAAARGIPTPAAKEIVRGALKDSSVEIRDAAAPKVKGETQVKKK